LFPAVKSFACTSDFSIETFSNLNQLEVSRVTQSYITNLCIKYIPII